MFNGNIPSQLVLHNKEKQIKFTIHYEDGHYEVLLLNWEGHNNYRIRDITPMVFGLKLWIAEVFDIAMFTYEWDGLEKALSDLKHNSIERQGKRDAKKNES